MKQNGIALIQILIITAILSVMAMHFTTTARDQVQMAQWANDKSQAQIQLQSAQAQLLFEFLTNSKSSEVEVEPQIIASKWNFYNEEFTVLNGLLNNQISSQSKVSVKMQDLAALINYIFLSTSVLINGCNIQA